MIRLRPALPYLLVLGAASCGGGDLVLPNEGQAARIVSVSGDGQTGTILEPAAESLVVQVVDRFGSPVPNVEVTWTPGLGGGEVSPTSVLTDPGGRAATQRILGDQVGTYLTTAVATPLPDNAISFTTTAVAARLVLETQPGAVATTGVPIDPQPVLTLQDTQGAPLARAGVTVTVQIASGTGELRGTTSQVSDADGRVTFTDLAIVGDPGSRTLIFAAPGYAPAVSTPVSLGVGPPASVAPAGGDGQTAPAGAPVAVRPSVLVRDAGGTAVANVPVTFAVASGGGSVTGTDATTGADGVAKVGSWTLGDAAGSNTLTATVQAGGVSGNPVTFTATAVPGTPDAGQSSIAVSPASIPASDGASSSQVTVVVKDAGGNPIPGQTVTLSATGAGVSLDQPAPTDGNGSTTGRFSATASGSHDITAVSGGVTLGSKTVTVTPGAPAPTRTVVQAPSGSAGVPSIVLVSLEDAFGNPVGGAAGQIAVSVGGANAGANVTVEDAGGGSYRARYMPSAVGQDQLDVRVGGQPVPGSPFSSQVAAGPADPGQTTANVPDGAFAVPLEITVQVRDALGNPLGRGGDAVTVTPAGSAGLKVEDRGDGTYRAVWTPFIVGRVPVTITLNGAQIAGSPYTTNIRFFR
jgi:adhesin/invasin